MSRYYIHENEIERKCLKRLSKKLNKVLYSVQHKRTITCIIKMLRSQSEHIGQWATPHRFIIIIKRRLRMCEKPV